MSSYGRRPPTLSNRPKRQRGSLPAWLVFIVAIALVFGAYYLLVGARDFLQTGGLGVSEATERAVVIASATAARQSTRVIGQDAVFGITQAPSETPIPPCQEFVVTVTNAILRSDPTTRGNILNTLQEGQTVCVVGREPDSEWYTIDTNPLTRRLDLGYMREDLLQALNPTLTPSRTFTPAPSVTLPPTLTPSITPTITPTPTRDPRDTDTPTPTLTPRPTGVIESA